MNTFTTLRPTVLRGSVLQTALAIGLGLTGSAIAQERAVVVEADRIVVAPRTTLEGADARLAFRAGKVVGVGSEIPRDLLDSARRVRFPGATIVPGFVVAHDYLELASDLAEQITAFTPALEAADAFDPFDKSLTRFAQGGVTGVGLAPSSFNTLAGAASVVQWTPYGGDVLEPATYLKAALVPESLNQQRFPTSRMGAADLIRQRFTDVSSALAPNDADHRRLAEVLQGGRQFAVHARTVAEITEALELCAEFELQPLILGADEAGSCIEMLRTAGATVVVGQLDFDDDTEKLELPAALAAASIQFSLSAPHPDQLRRSAALAVRHGLDRDTALAALTRIPATQLGVQDRVGSLRTGHSADFAVYTGDPLDLSSTLQAVWIQGVRVTPASGTQENKQ